MNQLDKSQLRYLLVHRFQTLLTLLGIALGVAVVHAVDITNYSAKKNLTQTSQQLSGLATHRIIADDGTIAESIYQQLRSDFLATFPSLQISPSIQKTIHLEKGFQDKALLLGIDPFASLLEVDFFNRSAENNSFALDQFLFDNNTVLVSSKLAQTKNLQINDRLSIYVDNQPKDLIVIGILPETSLNTSAIIMDIGNAQDILSLPGQLSTIELKIPNNSDATRLIDNQLPAGLNLLTIDSLIDGQSELISALMFNLSALSYLAMIVGGFLIFNTVRFSMLQRLPSFVRLRIIGLQDSQLTLLLLREALLLSLIGTFAGILLGQLLSKTLGPITQQTISNLYALQTDTSLTLHWSLYLKAAISGVTITLVAAYLSLLTIDRRRLVSSMSRIYQERVATVNHIGNLIKAVALCSAGIFTMQTNSLLISYVSVLCFTASGLLLIPSFLTIAYRILYLLARHLRCSQITLIAIRDCQREQSRILLSIIALSLAVASTNGIATMISSFKQSVDIWLDQQLAAEFYLRSTQPDPDKATISTEIIQQINNLSEVSFISTTRFSRVLINNRFVPLVAISTDNDINLPIQVVEGSLDSFRAGGLLISESFARKQSLSLDDTIALNTPTGENIFTVIGIVRDYGSEHGRLFIHGSTFNQFWNDTRVTSIGVHLKDTMAKDKVIDRLKNQWLEQYQLGLLDSSILREQIIKVFNQTFASTHFLRILVLVIAVIAIISTLLIYQIQRRRQLSTLYSLGMSTKELASLFYYQAFLIGGIAGAIAIPLGLLIAWCLVAIINPAAFGWSLVYKPEANVFLLGFIIAIIAGLLSAIYPSLHYQHQMKSMDLQYE